MSTEVVVALIAAAVGIIGSAITLALGLRSIRLERGKLQVDRERLQLELDKLNWDQDREITFETLQILFELNRGANSILYHLDHVYNLIKWPSNLQSRQRSYTVSVLCFSVAKLISTIQNTHRIELHLALHEQSARALEDLTGKFCQFISDRGVLRDYQIQLAEESKAHKTASSFHEANIVSTEAYKLLEVWAEELVADYGAALIALEQGDSRPFPSLRERNIRFQSRKIADVGPLQLTDHSATFLLLLVNLAEFVPEQSLMGLYKGSWLPYS